VEAVAAEQVTELERSVLALCPGWRAKDLSDFRYLPGGYSNRNYRFCHRGSHFVLRIPERSRPFIDRDLEYAFYQSPGDVLIPEIQAFEPTTGWMISRWQTGTLLSDLEPDSAALVPYVGKLHRGLPPCPRRYDPLALAREYLSIGNATPEIVELAHRSTWNPPETTACHNDLNPWNIIRPGSSEWITLDWEWLGENDPLFDLVTLHQGLALDDALLVELSEELLGASASQRRVRDCLLAFWLREYAWAHAELTVGNDRSEIREQLRLSFEKLGALR
jgi:aminoglycoside phosphotransferase (APT) family kinase protein